jgi:hypothetical protein
MNNECFGVNNERLKYSYDPKGLVPGFFSRAEKMIPG